MPTVRMGFSVASHSGPKMASKALSVLLQVQLLLEVGSLQHVCACRASTCAYIHVCAYIVVYAHTVFMYVNWDLLLSFYLLPSL